MQVQELVLGRQFVDALQHITVESGGVVTGLAHGRRGDRGFALGLGGDNPCTPGICRELDPDALRQRLGVWPGGLVSRRMSATVASGMCSISAMAAANGIAKSATEVPPRSSVPWPARSPLFRALSA